MMVCEFGHALDVEWEWGERHKVCRRCQWANS